MVPRHRLALAAAATAPHTHYGHGWPDLGAGRYSRRRGWDEMASSNPRTANGARRRGLRAQVLAEESACWICGGPVDKTLTVEWGKHGPKCKGDGCPGCVPHPMRAEVDEVVPVSKGGSPYDRSNCRLSHRQCNRQRGNGDRKPDPMPVEMFPLSACWGGIFDSLSTT